MSSVNVQVNLLGNNQVGSAVQGAISNLQTLDNAVKNSMRQRTTAQQRYIASLASQENIQKRIEKQQQILNAQSIADITKRKQQLLTAKAQQESLIKRLSSRNNSINEALNKRDIQQLKNLHFLERDSTTKTIKSIPFVDKLTNILAEDKNLTTGRQKRLFNDLVNFQQTGHASKKLNNYVQNINWGTVKDVQEGQDIKTNTQQIKEAKRRIKGYDSELTKLNRADSFITNQQQAFQNQKTETERLRQEFQNAQNKIPTDIKNLREELSKNLSNGILKDEIDKVKQGGTLTKRELRRANRTYNGAIRSIRGLFSAINMPLDVRSATLADFNAAITNPNVGFRRINSAGNAEIVPLTPQQQQDYRRLFQLSTNLVDQKDSLLSSKSPAKDLQDDINQKNMSLYALSHALKAVEVPIQQGVEIGKGTIDEYVNFQSAMVGVAKLLPALRDQKTLLVNDKFKQFRQGVLDLTNELPRSGVELAHAAESASRLGVTNPDQILKVVEAGTMLGNAFGMASDDVTTQIVKIANAKGINLNKSDSLEKVMEFADAINYLDDHTAATGRDILEFTKRAVQTAEGVKMDTKDVAAFGATLVSLGITADQANTAFKNLMTVLQTGPRNRTKGVKYLEKSGFKVDELMTQFKKNPTETALQFIKRLKELRSAPAGEDAAAIVRFAFGQMSSQGIMALVNNPETLEKYIDQARKDSKGWTLKEHTAKQINDPAVRFKLLSQKIQQLQIDTGEILMPVAENFIKSIKGIASALTPFVKDNSGLIQNTAYTSMGLLAAVKGAGFLVDTATIFNNLRNWKAVQNFGTKWADMMSKSKGLNKILEILGKPGQGIYNLWTKPIGGVGGVAGAGGWTLGSTILGFIGSALAGWGIGRGIATWRGFDGKGKSIDDLFFENGIINKSDIAHTKTRGTIQDTIRRNTAQHSSVFLNKKYNDLVERLHSKGYNIDENGHIFRYGKELHLQEDVEGSRLLWDWTSPFGYKISESKDSELFELIDQLQNTKAKIKGARAREGILNIDNAFSRSQKDQADKRVELEQGLVARQALANKYAKEGQYARQAYQETKIKEIKDELHKIKEWQAKARQIVEENKNNPTANWNELLAGVDNTVIKTPEQKKKDKQKKELSQMQYLNQLVDSNQIKSNPVLSFVLEQQRNTAYLNRAQELYEEWKGMKSLKITNPETYNKAGGDVQYQKINDWFAGILPTIAQQQGYGTGQDAINKALDLIETKLTTQQKAIDDVKGKMTEYNSSSQKGLEDTGKKADDLKNKIVAMTETPYVFNVDINTANFDKQIAHMKSQLNSVGKGTLTADTGGSSSYNSYAA